MAPEWSSWRAGGFHSLRQVLILQRISGPREMPDQFWSECFCSQVRSLAVNDSLKLSGIIAEHLRCFLSRRHRPTLQEPDQRFLGLTCRRLTHGVRKLPGATVGHPLSLSS
jgi:hypothetical protein